MRFNIEVIVAAFALITGVIAIPEPVADPIGVLGGLLQPRADDSCDYSDPCTAFKGTKSGVYCGYCSAVLSDFKSNFAAYQLNPQGGCCRFGTSSVCVEGASVGARGDQKLCPNAA